MRNGCFDDAFWREQAKKYEMEITVDKKILTNVPQKKYKTPSKSSSHSSEKRKINKSLSGRSAYPTSTNTLQIDPLLAISDPARLDNLDSEIFRMLESFRQFTANFVSVYTNRCQERDYAILKNDSDTQNKIDEINSKYSEKRKNICIENEKNIRTIREQFEKDHNKREEKVQNVEHKFEKWKIQQRKLLKQQREGHRADQAQIKFTIIDKIEEYNRTAYNCVSKKLKMVMEKIWADDVPVNTEDTEALRSYLNDEITQDAESRCFEIQKESNTFLHRRLPLLCEKLALIYAQAKKAYSILVQLHEDEERQAQADFTAEVSKTESNVEEFKKSSQAEDVRQQIAADLEIERIKDSMNKDTNKMNEAAQAEKASARKEQKAEKQRLYKESKEKLDDLASAFETSMESVFPAENMQTLFAYLNSLCERMNEPFVQNVEPQHSVAIGEAFIPLSDEGNGSTEAYTSLRRFLKAKYACMFQEDDVALWIRIPYIISVDKGMALLLQYEDREEEKIRDQVNGIGIRMLWSIPASLQEFCLFDAGAIGSYLALQALDPAQSQASVNRMIRSMVIGGRVFQRKDEISKQLGEMRTHFEGLKVSMQPHKTLRKFNLSRSTTREKYQMLIAHHFPTNIDADSIMTIATMAKDCRPSGFSAILAMSKSHKMDEHSLQQVEELMRYFTVLELQNDGYFSSFSAQTAAEKSARISLFSAPDEAILEKMQLDYFGASQGASSIAVNLDKIMPSPQERYLASASLGMVNPIGLLRGGSVFELRMDMARIHTILSGVTGSGKTNLLHTLILSLMLCYPPDEVELYLIDYKHGIDFGIYGNYNLPCLRVLSITNEADFPLSALEEIKGEYDRRAYEFSKAYDKEKSEVEDDGGECDFGSIHDINEYNQIHPEKKMRRIVLIIDELYLLLKDATERGGDTAEKIMFILDKIAHSGRAIGIHMVLCGQDLSKIDGIDNLIEQSANRIAMNTSDEDVKMLFKKEERALALMHEVGPDNQSTCVFSNDFGNNSITLAYIPEVTAGKQHRLLKSISDHYTQMGVQSNVRILLTEPSKSIYHPFRRFVDRGVLPEREQLYIGEVSSWKREFVYFPDNNLWLIGGNSFQAEFAGYGAMFSCLLSLLLLKLKTHARGSSFEVFCSDGSDDGFGNNDPNNRFWQFCDALRQQDGLIDFIAGNKLAHHISTLSDILDKRRRSDHAHHHPIWLLVSQIDKCRKLSDQDRQKLMNILNNGPQHDIHAILWTRNALGAMNIHLADGVCDKLLLETSNPEAFGVDFSQNIAVGFRAQLSSINGGDTVLRLYDLPVRPWLEEIVQRLSALWKQHASSRLH